MIRQRQKQSCDNASSSSSGSGGGGGDGGGSRDEVEEVRNGRAGVPGTVWYDTVQYNTGKLLVTFVPTRQNGGKHSQTRNT